MTRIVFISVLCAIFIHNIRSQAISYPIDASHSVISFSVGFAGGITSIDGRFDQFEGVLGYKDVNDLSSFYCEVTIEVSSINTGDTQRDKDLLGEGFFNVESNPTITFNSSKVIQNPNGLNLVGTLSMLGKVKEIKLPIQFKHPDQVIWVFGEPRIAAEANYLIDRLEYEIPKRGWDNIIPSLGSMTLSKDVDIKLVIQAAGPGLSQLLRETINDDNVEKAVMLYNELESSSEVGTYEFGERTLLSVIMALNRGDKLNEALDFGKFSVSRFPDSFMTWYGLALSHEALKNETEAIKCYEKSIELNSEFGRARKALEKLKKN